jgi:hypothetical protein
MSAFTQVAIRGDIAFAFPCPIQSIDSRIDILLQSDLYAPSLQICAPMAVRLWTNAPARTPQSLVGRLAHSRFIAVCQSPLKQRLAGSDCSPVQTDSRNRLSKFWTPTGGISQQDGDQGPQATAMPIAQLTAESRRFTCPSPPWRLSSSGTTFYSSVTTPISSRVGSLWSIPSPTARPARAKQA